MGLVAARCTKCDTNAQFDNLQDTASCPHCSEIVNVRDSIKYLWDYNMAGGKKSESSDSDNKEGAPRDSSAQSGGSSALDGSTAAASSSAPQQSEDSLAQIGSELPTNLIDGALTGNRGNERKIDEIASIAKSAAMDTSVASGDSTSDEETCLAEAKRCFVRADLKGAVEHLNQALKHNKKSHRALFGKFLATGLVQNYLDAVNVSTKSYMEKYKVLGHAINVESFLKYEYLIKNVTSKLSRADADYLLGFNILNFKSGIDGGLSVMHVVAASDNIEAFRMLFEEGMSVNIYNESGSQPIHIAAFAGSGDTIKLLSNAGADVNSMSKLGYTPVILAVLTGNQSNLRSLISCGADVNKGDKAGHTPLHYSVNFGDGAKIESIKMLAAAQADMSPKNDEGNTPLHDAVGNERVSVAQTLVNLGADINVRNEDGKTALHLACRMSSRDMARFLIQNGAQVTVMDNAGNTPLHVAARSGHVEVAKMLIEEGARVEATNRMNQKPITVAKLRNMDKMVNYLKKFDAEKAAVEKSGKKGGRCYIATAVYGSYDAPQVLVLRRFRDEVLMTNPLGKAFVKLYYFASPPVAKKLEKASFINRAVRGLLDKFVKFCDK